MFAARMFPLNATIRTAKVGVATRAIFIKTTTTKG